MPKIIVSFEFSSEAEVIAFLQNGGQGKSVPTQPATSMPTAAQLPPTAGQASAPPPQSSAAVGLPASAPAAPPPAPPAPGPASGNPQATEALAAMQAYSQQHKAAGVKKVLARAGVTQITQGTPEQLTWLIAWFKSGASPEQLPA